MTEMDKDQDLEKGPVTVTEMALDNTSQTMDSQHSRASSGATLQNSSAESSCSDLNIEARVKPSLHQELELRQEFKDLEKGPEADILPSPRRLAWLRYTGLNIYRRLFSLAFIGNLIAFVYIMVHNRSPLDFVNAAAANLLALGLARQPLVVNALFLTFAAIPRSAPLRLRRIFAKIYCYGGVHSGCGVASLFWYTGLVALLIQQYVRQQRHTASGVEVTVPILVLSLFILLFLILIILAAIPRIRFKLHDWFELTHRFLGWAVIIFFWPLLALFSLNAAAANHQSLGRFLLTFPTFWMLIITTLAILHPWALLRRVPVRAEYLSTHAVRLHFDHTTINFGQGMSVSRHPLKDWHSFATFPDLPSLPGTSGTTKDAPQFSCLISKAGDWTTNAIVNPPTHLWKRAIPIYGFGYVMKVFKRMVLVTTGSGIGPCLSFLGDPNRPAMRVIWQTRTPLKTYGAPVVDLVAQLDPNALIIDTSTVGKRVDMLPLVVRMAKEFDAEAVCVISNPVMTRKLVFNCEGRGVPAFGPIFDS